MSKINSINWRSLAKKTRVKQVGSLYTSMLLSIIIGIAVSVVNTRLLGSEQYGDLKFLQNLFSLGVTFLTCGVFVTGSRLLAQNRNENRQKDIIGCLFAFAALIYSVYLPVLFFFSFFEDMIFNNDLGFLIRLLCPLLFVYPFKLCLDKIMIGTNQIYKLSIYRIAPQVFYLVAVTAFNFVADLSLSTALLIQLLSLFFVLLVTTVSFKPKFKSLIVCGHMIIKRNKSHGLQVYIGLLFGVGVGRLAVIFIAYFVDNISVGYYSLALTIAMPLSMIPNIVGTTFYKSFAGLKSIPTNVTKITVLLSLSALFLFFVFIEKIILLLYSAEYVAAVPLAYFISIGCILHGFGDYINRFIGSHGKGKFIRNGAICVGISNILGYVVLIKLFGVTGAAMTKILSGSVYLVSMLFYYNRLRSNLSPQVTP